jgi:tetratricopeptide (TPR) repeat protein
VNRSGSIFRPLSGLAYAILGGALAVGAMVLYDYHQSGPQRRYREVINLWEQGEYDQAVAQYRQNIGKHSGLFTSSGLVALYAQMYQAQKGIEPVRASVYKQQALQLVDSLEREDRSNGLALHRLGRIVQGYLDEPVRARDLYVKSLALLSSNVNQCSEAHDMLRIDAEIACSLVLEDLRSRINGLPQ